MSSDTVYDLRTQAPPEGNDWKSLTLKFSKEVSDDTPYPRLTALFELRDEEGRSLGILGPLPEEPNGPTSLATLQGYQPAWDRRAIDDGYTSAQHDLPRALNAVLRSAQCLEKAYLWHDQPETGDLVSERKVLPGAITKAFLDEVGEAIGAAFEAREKPCDVSVESLQRLERGSDGGVPLAQGTMLEMLPAVRRAAWAQTTGYLQHSLALFIDPPEDPVTSQKFDNFAKTAVTLRSSEAWLLRKTNPGHCLSGDSACQLRSHTSPGSCAAYKAALESLDSKDLQSVFGLRGSNAGDADASVV
jgi:hypothetical protein